MCSHAQCQNIFSFTVSEYVLMHGVRICAGVHILRTFRCRTHILCTHSDILHTCAANSSRTRRLTHPHRSMLPRHSTRPRRSTRESLSLSLSLIFSFSLSRFLNLCLYLCLCLCLCLPYTTTLPMRRALTAHRRVGCEKVVCLPSVSSPEWYRVHILTPYTPVPPMRRALTAQKRAGCEKSSVSS